MNVAPEALDQTSLDEILIRWKLADLHIDVFPLDDKLPACQALRLLIRRDIPKLLRELRRLRPELASV
jgi:hypothetical protein